MIERAHANPDELGRASDVLAASLDALLASLDVPLVADATDRPAALALFREALGTWMAVLIGRCATQAASTVIGQHEAIEELKQRVSALEDIYE